MRCYVDYTCGHSYRAWTWLRSLGIPVDWRTFSLKEVNRDPGEPRAFADAESMSIAALALAHAARAADFARYHAAAFEAFHEGRVEREDLLRIAKEAGVDAGALDHDALRQAVAAEHDEACERWGAFGTPTIVDGDRVAFLRVEEIPAVEGVLDRVLALAKPEGITIRLTATGAEPASDPTG